LPALLNLRRKLRGDLQEAKAQKLGVEVGSDLNPQHPKVDG
jgi:hypothetical protein